MISKKILSTNFIFENVFIQIEKIPYINTKIHQYCNILKTIELFKTVLSIYFKFKKDFIQIGKIPYIIKTNQSLKQLQKKS